MDFHTGGTGGPSSGSGGTPGGTSVGSSGEFTYRDPVQSFVTTFRRLVVEPANFFRNVLRHGDFVNPLVFALICWEVSAILGGLLSLAGIGAGQGLGSLPGWTILGFMLGIIFAPLFAAIGLFIGAGIIHLLVMRIVGSHNAGFEATFRVLAYSAVTFLVYWIPLIGGILSLYSIYLGIVGIREMHNTTTDKAAPVVLIPVAVVLLLVFLLGGASAISSGFFHI